MAKKFDKASYLTNCSMVTITLIFAGGCFFNIHNQTKLIIYLVFSLIASNIIALFIIKPLLRKLLKNG